MVVPRIVLCLGLLAAAGCGSGRVPVGGRVTLDGRPLGGVLVDFCPEDGSRPQGGLTDPDGRYVIASHRHEAGTPPGNYTVTITRDGAPVVRPRPGDPDRTVTVTRDGGTFDFDLRSGPK